MLIRKLLHGFGHSCLASHRKSNRRDIVSPDVATSHVDVHREMSLTRCCWLFI